MDYKEQAELNKALAAKWNKCSCIYKIGGMKPKEFLLLNATAITDLLARAEAAERERDEAVHDRMVMEKRTAELVDRAEAYNKKLIAAMMQLKRTDRPERISVVYELEYNSSLSHKTTEDVAGILFRGLMDSDLKMRGQKEE